MRTRRWAWLALLLVGAVATATLVKYGNARDDIDRAGKPLPEGSFRVSIDKLIEGDDISIHTLTIETQPQAWIQVMSQKPQGGGGSVLAGDNTRDGSPPSARLMLIGDQLNWSAGHSDLRRFLLRLEGGGGSSTSSDIGPMEAGKKLDSVLKLFLKPGLYPYGQPIQLLNFEGRSFELIVQKSRVSIE